MGVADSQAHHHDDPYRTRYLWPDRSPRRPPVGRADAALAAELRHRRRPHAARADRRAGPHQARQRRRQPAPGPAAGRQGERGHRRGRRGHRRQASGRVPAGGLADRLRHAEQHEHERGARQPRQRTAGRRARRSPPGAPQRRRKPQPIVQRRVPDGDARGGRHRHHAAPAAVAARAARDARAQGHRLRRHHQDRPHPPAGRHAAHARPGVLRLRGPAAAQRDAPERRAAAPVRAGAGRHGGRHRPECAGRLCRTGGRRTRRADRPALRHLAQQVRDHGLGRRPGARARRPGRRWPPA